jgi:hypothetical protein
MFSPAVDFRSLSRILDFQESACVFHMRFIILTGIESKFMPCSGVTPHAKFSSFEMQESLYPFIEVLKDERPGYTDVT